MDTSKAAAAMGRAGRGASKRRGGWSISCHWADGTTVADDFAFAARRPVFAREADAQRETARLNAEAPTRDWRSCFAEGEEPQVPRYEAYSLAGDYYRALRALRTYKATMTTADGTTKAVRVTIPED